MSKLISQTAQWKDFRGYTLWDIFFEIAEWLKDKEGPARIDALDMSYDHEYNDWTVKIFFDARCTFE